MDSVGCFGFGFGFDHIRADVFLLLMDFTFPSTYSTR